MRCIALEDGHDGSQFRPANSVFDVSDERIGKDGKPADGSTWYVALEQAPPEKPKPERPPGAGPKPGSNVT